VTKQNLLVVDADPRSLRVLEVSLRNAGYNVAGCPSVGKALEILHANKPDLILSDTTFSDMNGFDFVEQLRQNSEWSQIPFMFLSSDGSIESKIRGLELGVEDYLTKPIYIREVVARVGIELARQRRAGLAHKSSDARTRFSGSLSEMSVVDLLQTIDVSRKSGVLTLVSTDGQEGMISFDSGAVINATVEDLVGEDAIYRHLLWHDGTFDLEFRRVSLSERTVHRTTQALLMEGMRRLDEWSRLSELLPPFETVLEVDPAMLRERLREMPDDQNAMVRLIDGTMTVSEVLRAHGGDHVEALRKVVDLYFEGMVREVGRIQDSIPILTEVSVRSSAPPLKEGVNTIPGPAGLPVAPLAVPAAPSVPTMTPLSRSAIVSELPAVFGPTSDHLTTPVSLPAPDSQEDLELEEATTTPSGSPPKLELGWQPAPAPGSSRKVTPKGFQAVRPQSSKYAGGTILNWAGRVPEIDTIEEVSGRETVEVGQWDRSLEDLREDPEVEEAIVAIDSDPPPGPFVRSSPPGPPLEDQAEAVAFAAVRQSTPVPSYHEPPEVDPPPLTYEQVFNDTQSAASLKAPRPVQPTSLTAKSSSASSMLPWALLILGVGFAFAAVVFLTSPWRGPQPAPSIELVAVGEPEPEMERAAATKPAPAPEPLAPKEPLDAEDATPVPVPEVIYAETGAIDTYDAQLALARRLKRGSRAVAAYRRAIELNPQESPALAELGRLMLARNNTREAAELAERATAIDPSNALAWVTLGAARQTRGDRQGARQAYQNCVKLGQGQYVSECRAMLR